MIVSNTTPISNLLHINQILLLDKLLGTIYIPPAVAKELDIFFSNNAEWTKYLKKEKIIIHPISNTIVLKQMMPFLHQGEAEAICLCLEKKAKLCLLDDKDGRMIAQYNNVSITGTLGILIKAKQLGLISSVRPLLDKLRDEHCFWVSNEMYKKVLDILHEI